jgi:hypothetical protein
MLIRQNPSTTLGCCDIPQDLYKSVQDLRLANCKQYAKG